MKRGHVADRDNRIRTLAFTLENRTEVLPGLSLVSALRKDFIDVDLTNRRAVTASSPASASRSYSPLTGRLGLNGSSALKPRCTRNTPPPPIPRPA